MANENNENHENDPLPESAPPENVGARGGRYHDDETHFRCRRLCGRDA